MARNIKFLPVHIHYTAIMYNTYYILKGSSLIKFTTAFRKYVRSSSCFLPTSVLLSSTRFPIYIYTCTRGYINFSVQSHFWQWVPFPCWHVAICLSGAPLCIPSFLGISTIHAIRYIPKLIGGLLISWRVLVFHRGVAEVFVLRGLHAASLNRCFPKFIRKSGALIFRG